jgi:hypothetical protein
MSGAASAIAALALGPPATARLNGLLRAAQLSLQITNSTAVGAFLVKWTQMTSAATR